MGILIAKILKYLSENNRWAILLILLLMIVGGIVFNLQRNSINNWKEKHQTEVKLRNALVDSVNYYTNKYGEEVAEKLTLQTSIKNLESINNKLTESEQNLLKRVKDVEKENNIITAALIEAEATIDSLLGAGFVEINVEDSSFIFTDTTEFFIYDITIGKAFPAILNVNPTITFNKLTLPNEQFVNFHWKDNKKEGYPIAFSTTNTSPYYKTNNISSYAIPELQKQEINPTGWQKITKWFNKNGKIVGFVAGGVVVGAAGTYVIMNAQ